jgi:hypothetical protein
MYSAKMGFYIVCTQETQESVSKFFSLRDRTLILKIVYSRRLFLLCTVRKEISSSYHDNSVFGACSKNF